VVTCVFDINAGTCTEVILAYEDVITDPVAGDADGSVVRYSIPEIDALTEFILVIYCFEVTVTSNVLPEGAIILDHTLPPLPQTLLVPVKLLSKYIGL
jgi:hypothetical protein